VQPGIYKHPQYIEGNGDIIVLADAGAFFVWAPSVTILFPRLHSCAILNPCEANL
jgi:hypothetical protein